MRRLEISNQGVDVPRIHPKGQDWEKEVVRESDYVILPWSF